MGWDGITTTVFHPDPSCFAPSNLWTNWLPCQSIPDITQLNGTLGSDSEELRCGLSVLGPRDDDDDDARARCIQPDGLDLLGHALTAWTDCPDGMTVAGVQEYIMRHWGYDKYDSTSWIDDVVTHYTTHCCPAAYPPFEHKTIEPSWGPGFGVYRPLVDGTANLLTLMDSAKKHSFRVTLPAPNTDVCIAAMMSAPPAESPVPTPAAVATTTLTTDYYKLEFILATPAIISKMVYPAKQTAASNSRKPEVSSTCYGPVDSRCGPWADRMLPTPHPADPSTTYVPPTTPPLTRFTPAPSCIPSSAGDGLWKIADVQYVQCADKPAPLFNPESRFVCPIAMTFAGDPDVATNFDCYYEPGTATRGRDGSRTYWTGCPVGFTPAATASKKKFDVTEDPRTGSTVSYVAGPFDVVWRVVACCPSISGLDFKFEIGDNLYSNTFGRLLDPPQTVNTHKTVFSIGLPHCVARQVTALSEPVTMTVWDPAHREGGAFALTTIADWGAADGEGVIYAQNIAYAHVVFHGTHTCYDRCDDYFTSSYYNTDPNYTPPPAPTVTSAGSTETSTPDSSSDHDGGHVIDLLEEMYLVRIVVLILTPLTLIVWMCVTFLSRTQSRHDITTIDSVI